MPVGITIVDSHLHLQDAALAAHRDDLLGRAAAAGVCAMVCNGTSESDWPAVLELARTHRQVIPCFGLHPWYVGQRTPRWLETLGDLLKTTSAGVGEIGLDRWIEPRDDAAQETVFRTQLELARQLNRPVMIHCVRAWDRLMALLHDAGSLPAGMMLHAYGGPAELIKQLSNLGAYFSVAGNTLRQQAHRRRESLRQIPRDRLLIESDAPDLIPPPEYAPHRLAGPEGKPVNEPANLPVVLRGIAAVLGEPEESLAESILENSRRFFGPLLVSGTFGDV